MENMECLRCGYVRKEGETEAPEQCPQCGAYYAKVAAQARKALKDAREKSAAEANTQSPPNNATVKKSSLFKKTIKAIGAAKAAPKQVRVAQRSQMKTLIRTYKGKQSTAITAYQTEAAGLETEGFEPMDQVWEPGQWGCGIFLLAAVLIFAGGIGIIMILGLLIVKPAGTLTVTYKRKDSARAIMK